MFSNSSTITRLFDINQKTLPDGSQEAAWLTPEWKLCIRTHSVQVSEALIHLGVAEYGVTFAHSPQHALEGLHLHALDEAGHEAAASESRRLSVRLGSN